MKNCTLERIWFGRTVSTPCFLTPARILLADDHDDFGTLVRAYLAPHGFTVDTVTNGADALTCVAQVSYDLILVDIQMPGMDGYQLTERLRAGGYARPILAVTAHAMAPHLDRAIAAGCNAVYTKPVSLPALREAIERNLSTSAALTR